MSVPVGRINAHDHGPRLVLAAALMLVYTCIALGLRLTARWPSGRRAVQREDIALVAAAISSIGYTACICVAVSHDFGHHENDITLSNKRTINTALRTSFLIFFVTEGLANLSYSLFVRSLSASPTRGFMFRILYVVIAVTTLAGVICSGIYIGDNYSNLRSMWIVLGAVEIAILFALFLLNMWMIWSMQTSLARRARASLWFSFVLVVVAVAVVRLIYTPEHIFAGDFSFDAITFFVILTIEMHLSIINAAYPNLLVFINKASTGFYNTAPRINTNDQISSNSANERKNGSSVKQDSLRLRDDTVYEFTNTAHGGHRETEGMQRHGDQTILVSKSLTVDG